MGSETPGKRSVRHAASGLCPARHRSYTSSTVELRYNSLLTTHCNAMETEWYNRAEAIQKRITQLRDSL